MLKAPHGSRLVEMTTPNPDATLPPSEFTPKEIFTAEYVFQVLKTTAAIEAYKDHGWFEAYDLAVAMEMESPTRFADRVGKLMEVGYNQKEAISLANQILENENAEIAVGREERRLKAELKQTEQRAIQEREQFLQEQSRLRIQAKEEKEEIRAREASERRKESFSKQQFGWQPLELNLHHGTRDALLNLSALVFKAQEAVNTTENPNAVQDLCTTLENAYHFPTPDEQQRSDFHSTFSHVAELLGNPEALTWKELADWHAEKMQKAAAKNDV